MKEGLSLQGKEKGGEKGLFGEGKQARLWAVSGLGGNETTREGVTRWAPSGEARENDPEHS